jgi:hypothetical protein
LNQRGTAVDHGRPSRHWEDGHLVEIWRAKVRPPGYNKAVLDDRSGHSAAWSYRWSAGSGNTMAAVGVNSWIS